MKSIRRQLTRHLLAATLVPLGGGLLAVYLLAREMVVEQFDAALRAKAFALTTLTRVEPSGITLAFTDRFLRGFEHDRARDFFQLWDARGRTLARSASLRQRGELPARFGRSDKPERWNLTLPTGRPGRAIGFKFTPRSDGTGGNDAAMELRLVVATDASDLAEVLCGLLGLSAGCGLLLAGATVWLIPRVLRRGLAPLERLGDQAARIDAGSLAVRFDVAALPDELQPIAGRLNDLLARLEQSFERERRFSADLAHELRTPLAELRSQAECALQWPDSRDPATDRETLAIAQQMERLVTHLLALARGEQGGLPVEAGAVALDDLVRAVQRTFAARAAERDLAFHAALYPVTVNADAALLRSILINLCENAVTYAPSGTAVTFDLTTRGDRAALAIANAAGDLTAPDFERIFDRFWRKEAARTGGRHFGLGLPVAQTFATAMNWTLDAALVDGRAIFTLRGPIAAEKPQP